SLNIRCSRSPAGCFVAQRSTGLIPTKLPQLNGIIGISLSNSLCCLRCLRPAPAPVSAWTALSRYEASTCCINLKSSLPLGHFLHLLYLFHLSPYTAAVKESCP